LKEVIVFRTGIAVNLTLVPFAAKGFFCGGIGCGRPIESNSGVGGQDILLSRSKDGFFTTDTSSLNITRVAGDRVGRLKINASSAIPKIDATAAPLIIPTVAIEVDGAD